MDKQIVALWEANKKNLEEYFRITPQSEYSGSYETIVKALFEKVLNAENDEWDIAKLTVIDHGDYQGTQLFLIPKNTYQPSASEYLITCTSYGSCSGCDTLQGISEYGDDKPSEGQLSQYMTLALHLVQQMKRLYGEEE
jgi:hypothetical protein